MRADARKSALCSVWTALNSTCLLISSPHAVYTLSTHLSARDERTMTQIVRRLLKCTEVWCEVWMWCEWLILYWFQPVCSASLSVQTYYSDTSAVYAMVLCPSVRLSQVRILPERLNVLLRKRRSTMPRDSTSPLNGGAKYRRRIGTSSSAAAERLREPLSQLKSCQLLHNCTKNHIWLEGLRIALSCGIKISPVGSLD